MMLTFFYSDPPMTEAEKKAYDEAKKNKKTVAEPKVLENITNYVSKATWSGDTEQAARKLQFEIAYNSLKKDIVFENLDLKLGGYIYMQEDNLELFEGRIFYRKRNTSSYVFNFTAFDDMIYLAKSKIQMVFNAVTITDAIKAICKEIGIEVSSDIPDLKTKVTFIADNKSCTEVFKMLTDKYKADITNNPDGKNFIVYCNQGKVNVIQKGTIIDNYVATDLTNVIDSEHSESIDNMVNRVKSIDDNGTICQVFTNKDDVDKFGIIQDVYKMEPPKKGETVDNTKAAKGNLKRVKNESSFNGIGYSQCITGFCISIQEEQLTGTFFIKSDTHEFQNNEHTMQLTLEYQPETVETPNITQEDIAKPVFKSSSKGKKSQNNGKGNMAVNEGFSAGFDAWAGETMDNGREGCVEAVGKMGSYYSPFLANECDNGVAGVDKLMADADSAGVPVEDYTGSNVSKGDVLVYVDNSGTTQHVVIADGEGGYIGNSPSNDCVVKGSDATQMSGYSIGYVIKTSQA